MSAAKDLLLKIKAMFDAPPPPTPPSPTTPVPTPFTLQDGTAIMIGIDDPTVSMLPDAGDMVTIAGSPCPAGDYTLQDGSVITTDDTGTITMVVAPAPETDPNFQQPPVLTLEERIAALEAKGTQAAPAQLETDINTANQKIADLTRQLETATGKFESQGTILKETFALMEMIVDKPMADPETLTGHKKEVFDKAKAKEDKFERMAASYKEARKAKQTA